jgi:hypothetical protein
MVLQEEKLRLEKETQEKQDAEFEKLNPDFCGQVSFFSPVIILVNHCEASQ